MSSPTTTESLTETNEPTTSRQEQILQDLLRKRVTFADNPSQLPVRRYLRSYKIKSILKVRSNEGPSNEGISENLLAEEESKSEGKRTIRNELNDKTGGASPKHKRSERPNFSAKRRKAAEMPPGGKATKKAKVVEKP